MRTIPLVLLAAVALGGCQSREVAWQKAYNEKRTLALQNGQEPARQPVRMAPKPRLAQDNPPMMVSGGPPIIMPVPIIVETAPPPQPSAPQPIIFTGGGSGTTIAQQVGNSTIVSQFGGWNSGTTIATQTGDTTIVSQFGGNRPPIGGYGPYYGRPVDLAPCW
jgi:hypothetical protein